MTYPDKNDIRQTLTAYAVSMVVWVLSAALFVLVASLLAFSAEDPDARIQSLALTTLFASVFIAGICSAAIGEKITTVIFTSLTIAAVVLLAASFKPDGMDSFGAAISALLYFAVPVVSFAGGILTLFVKKRRTAKPKKRNRRRR